MPCISTHGVIYVVYYQIPFRAIKLGMSVNLIHQRFANHGFHIAPYQWAFSPEEFNSLDVQNALGLFGACHVDFRVMRYKVEDLQVFTAGIEAY